MDGYPRAVAANLPEPRRRNFGSWVVALVLLVGSSAFLVLALDGALGGHPAAPAPPPIAIVAPTPVPDAPVAVARSPAAAVVAVRSTAAQRIDLARFRHGVIAHVPARWVAGFYPLYGLAAKTFGLNWLLLASIHAQETAFSTGADTYHGLNFANCCGGPMQFNVTNRPVSTWSLVSDSFRLARRPATYPHPTTRHPSIYDDFDAMMAAGRLLAADGAGIPLDLSAWRAAYDYYGHDPTGVTYADQVLARAIGWSQHGFCINCGLDAPLVAAVHAAYGAPVLATLQPHRHPKPAARRRSR